MESEKRLIDANALLDEIRESKDRHHHTEREISANHHMEHDAFMDLVDFAPTVDAVDVARIETVKQEILQRMDLFIAEYKRISGSTIDHFGGKADAMETARRLVNAALTDLCSYEERKENES